MAASTGNVPILTYAGGLNPITGVAMTTDNLRVLGLLALIPNPDTGIGSSGSNVPGTGNSYLDEMTPACAAALRAELTSLAANVT